MKKFVALIALFALLVAVSASAQPEWKTASKVGLITAGTTNVDCTSSASLLANYGWTKGTVVGLKAWAKGPFRIQIWDRGTGSTVWTPVDTTNVVRGGNGGVCVEFPCYQTFWVEADSFKIKPASSDSVRYELYRN